MMNASLDESDTVTDEEPNEIVMDSPSISKFALLKRRSATKSGRTVISARLVSWILKKLVQARTTYTTGLEIKVRADSNRHLLSGEVGEVEMKFDSIAFGQLFVTGGGTLVIEGLALKMTSFLFNNFNSLQKPYQIHGDFQLTQEDIVNSKLIKGLFQLLMNTILERALKVCCHCLYI
jgi:hypothetical protein